MDRQRNYQSRGGGHHTPNSINVPTIQQVYPGAAVSIVLKADQRTGRQVQGVVQDLLTRGNHPRGIKVRLQDGRIGRVQRMAGSSSQSTARPHLSNTQATGSSELVQAPRGFSEEYSPRLPQRSLADFLPTSGGKESSVSAGADPPTFTTAIAVCPICGLFEGDEVAVSHHVEEHLK